MSLCRGGVALFAGGFIDPLSSLKPSFCGCCLVSALAITKGPYISLAFIPFGSRSFNFAKRLCIVLSDACFMGHTIVGFPRGVGLGFISCVGVRRGFSHTRSNAERLLGRDVAARFGLISGDSNVCTGQSICCEGCRCRPSSGTLRTFQGPRGIVRRASTSNCSRTC